MKCNRLSIALFAILCGFVTFIACTKYKDSNSPSTDFPADKLVITSIQGRVVDENGLPVKGAVVSSGGVDTTTDVNGVFTFKDIQVSSRFGFVKVTKTGYFPGSRSLITNAAGSNYVTVSLIPRTAKGSFAAASGGPIVVQDGDTVVFDASSVVNAASNAAYTGNVHVFAAYLDPTDKDLSNHMPGDLRGIGKNGKETGLQTFGMMVVELEGDGGEKLQLASGKTASLTWAIPASLQAAAPASIPLWYFNDTTGKWIEQGTAARKGNSYIGTVSHFSYWNCDASIGLVNFTVRLKDQHGDPMPYTHVQFVSQNYGTRGGYTDTSGYAKGLIPQGETLIFQVLSQCGSVLFGENVGPALGDQDLGTITVTLNATTLTLTGTVVDCSNSPVASGFVNAYIEGLNYRAAVTAGAFTLSFVRCSNSTVPVELTAGDYGTSQQGATSQVSVSSGSQDVGQLSACGVTLDQFMHVTVNGTTYNVTAPPDSIRYYNQGGYASFDGYTVGSTSYTRVDFTLQNLTGTGTYPALYFDMSNANLYYTQQSSDPIQCSVSAYGSVNGFITGNFSGTLMDSVTKATYPMSGSFKVKRTN